MADSGLTLAVGYLFRVHKRDSTRQLAHTIKMALKAPLLVTARRLLNPMNTSWWQLACLTRRLFRVHSPYVELCNRLRGRVWVCVYPPPASASAQAETLSPVKRIWLVSKGTRGGVGVGRLTDVLTDKLASLHTGLVAGRAGRATHRCQMQDARCHLDGRWRCQIQDC